SIGHNWNSFHFDYSATAYGQQANIEYSIYLEGFDHKWSEWSAKTEKEYTKLWPGTYTFHVKARNNLGDESEVSAYTFTVLPPWYLTYWAYALYLIFFGAGLYSLHRTQKRKYEKQLQQAEEEQKRLQYLHQLEMEKSEKEIIKLRNEKLESEINHKNKELATAAMHLVQKGEMFTKVKDELLKLKKTAPVEKGGEDFKKIIRIISEEDRTEEDWEQFAHHFDKVHSDFLVALKEHFPKLTPNELKLCAYLRMNLSTKEIAQLMNISIRGVEISRYRLRKKLQIPTETNLFEHLMNFQNTASREELGSDSYRNRD
ncbi:MAG TPA: triple tyrosine motif-containing protein, partial [Chitinophagaceae bacterium]